MFYQQLIAFGLLLASAAAWLPLMKKRTPEPAEIRTGIPKAVVGLAVVMLGLVGAGAVAFFVTSLLTPIEEDAFFPIVAIIVLFLFLSWMLAVSVRREDEALVGETVVVRRVFKKEKRISVDRIRFIEANPQFIFFYDDSRRVLFQASSMTLRLPELIQAIAKRERYRTIDLTQLGGERIACQAVPESPDGIGAPAASDETVARLGRDYRNRIPKMLKDAKNAAWAAALLQISAIVVLISMTGNLFYLIFLPMAAVTGGTVYEATKKKTKVEGMSDHDLGLLYGHLDRRVVGSYRARTKQSYVSTWILGPLFLIMGVLVGFFSFTSAPPDIAGLESVTGAFAGYAENSDGDVFVFLEGDDTVYRISDLYADGVYAEIRAIARPGDPVALGIERRFEGTYNGDDATIGVTYLLSIKGLEVLEAEEVLAADRANQRLGTIMGAAMTAVGAMTVLVGVWILANRRRAEGRETIRL